MSRCSAISTNYRGRSSASRRWTASGSRYRRRRPPRRSSRRVPARPANAALRPLVTYFRLLATATPGGFDVEEAARLVFDWWQARCEAVGPAQYGVTVARVAAITYGKPADDPSLLISGIGRAEAMAYRDARGQAMTNLDWSEIECRGGAYRSLKAAVGAGNP